ncbi:MAG: RNase adapter RapZ [Silvanigrellaceae bacterium]
MQNKESQALSKIIIISGMAGSGKSVALRALEDIGFHCVDNLPAPLLSGFTDAIAGQQFHTPLVALALDARDKSMPATLTQIWTRLNSVAQVELLFLEADDSTLLNRFRETRRTHPLSQHGSGLAADSLAEAISLDAEILEPVRTLATRVIDTSKISSQMLRQIILHNYSPSAGELEIAVLLASFGFKHGAPVDLDTYFDVRCFPNPHYIPHLRPLTGLSPEVSDFVLRDPQVLKFLEKTTDLLSFLIPLYRSEGKRYLGVGVGCTGGKHRSVAIVEELGKRLRPILPNLKIEHRHFDRE